MVTEEAERVVGPSRASADDVASERDTMALLALLDWVPPLPIPFVVRFLPGAIAKADLNTYDRATSATRLQSCFHRRWRDVTSRRHIHLYTFVHIATEKIPNCNRFRTENSYGSKTYDLVPKRTILAPKQTFFGSQNSSGEDTPEHASAAWDHWTGRDCAAGRPSRSLCWDQPPFSSTQNLSLSLSEDHWDQPLELLIGRRVHPGPSNSSPLVAAGVSPPL